MPELPEVETIVQTMKPYLMKQKIHKCRFFSPHLFILPSMITVSSVWENKQVSGIERYGKYIQLLFSDGSAFIIHLRMTGQLFFQKIYEESKHVHLILELENGFFLYFRDVRKFARFHYIENKDVIDEFMPMGPDALTVSSDYLAEAGKRWPKSGIKSFLLNQNRIAGIGNIYADEICHSMGLHPEVHLSAVNLLLLTNTIKVILNKAIENGGTTFRDYRDASGKSGAFQDLLNVYGRRNCAVCGSILLKARVAGRTSTYCPRCQVN